MSSCRHEFHVGSNVNRVHFHAGMSFMSGLHVKGLQDTCGTLITKAEGIPLFPTVAKAI